MDNHKINEKIGATMNSLNGIERAAPAPYLLTRLNARLQHKPVQGFWSSAVALVSRPLVAGFGMVIFLIINILAITSSNSRNADNAVGQPTTISKYDFAINVSSIYDIENQEP